VIGGCLANVFGTGTTCPQVTEYLLKAGATDRHLGLLAGIPMAAILLQFVGALLASRCGNRKWPFIALFALSRALLLPVALLPLWFPSGYAPQAVVLAIWVFSLSAALSSLGVPFWYAWMADLVPRPITNRFWGGRQRWMSWTWTGSYLALAVYAYLYKGPIEDMLPWVVGLAVAAGVLDILLFIWVAEPSHARATAVPLLDMLLAPLRHRENRVFVIFNAMWIASTMVASVFMLPYAIKEMRMPGWQTTIVWCMLGVGGAMTSKLWGRLSDRHGEKPVIIANIIFKPMIAAVFLMITPATAFVVLSIAFLLDGAINGGLGVATTGLMMKLGPRQHRSMFSAYITGLSGLCGGVAAMLAGQYLHWTSDFAWTVAGREWHNYHLIFACSFFMRAGCIAYAFRLVEPDSGSATVVFNQMIGRWPLRFFRLPMDLYRGMVGDVGTKESEDDARAGAGNRTANRKV
jgi:MFS family permease